MGYPGLILEQGGVYFFLLLKYGGKYFVLVFEKEAMTFFSFLKGVGRGVYCDLENS